MQVRLDYQRKDRLKYLRDFFGLDTDTTLAALIDSTFDALASAEEKAASEGAVGRGQLPPAIPTEFLVRRNPDLPCPPGQYSNYKGVTKVGPHKYQAQIVDHSTHPSRTVYLGRFDSAVSASRAFTAAYWRMYPESKPKGVDELRLFGL